MKVLLVGGSGRVGTMITPHLRPHHELRVLDLVPPRHADLDYVAGSVLDAQTVRRALAGVESFIWLVMRYPQGGAVTTQDVPTILGSYDANAKGLHLFLYLAQEMGVTRGVYTSTMSVHYRFRPHYAGGRQYESEEATPLDTPSVYGLTKGFGELICQYFARWFNMNLIGLRLNGPREREHFLKERRDPPPHPGGYRLWITDEEDLAVAYLQALAAVQLGHGRFDAVFIAGDEHETEHNLSKARRVLGWAPRAQRHLPQA
jgi:nucleoside-diphosphate-sugar epimerase